MDKTYHPKKIESKIYKRWKESGFFNPDNLPSPKDKIFSVAMAPVNITGRIHMGHALENTLMDILVRKKRMQQYKVLWFPGTDHAGIATQVKVEKKLLKEGKSRHDLGREKFIKEIWKWKEKYGDIILDQFKKLGVSCDWSRERFTLDRAYSEAVKTAFKHYQDKGWIYQGNRLINWCPRCQTALSDLEVEVQESAGKLWYIRYPLASQEPGTDQKYIVVATTRPETMLGDTAIAVHPDDKRYKDMVGKTAILPLVGRKLPIITDWRVDTEFGTGALKVTPAHDKTDWEIGRDHNLKVIKVINFEGKMNDRTGDYQGLNVNQARNKIIEDLKQNRLLKKSERYTIQKGFCYRCHQAIEPLVSKQWFLKMDELANQAKQAVESGKVKITPERWTGAYLNWLDNIRDWCISRQIWWGHKIPIKGEKDVLDTWFSSALWPFAALGWPQNCSSLKNGICKQPQGDLKTYYPTNIITSAKGILYLWQVRMVFSGIEFMGEAPFNTIYVHPMVLNREGKRMSKSLGTGVDPLDLIEEFGADATRFGLAWQTTGVQAIKFTKDALDTGEKFANKVWNASRFVLQQVGNSKFQISPRTTRVQGKNDKLKAEKLTAADKKILKSLEQTIAAVDKDLEQFRFGQAARKLYHFFWDQYCDIYIEQSKKGKTNKKVLLIVLTKSLKLLHPFMPFITEEIYHKLPLKNKRKCLMIEPWPQKK